LDKVDNQRNNRELQALGRGHIHWGPKPDVILKTVHHLGNTRLRSLGLKIVVDHNPMTMSNASQITVVMDPTFKSRTFKAKVYNLGVKGHIQRDITGALKQDLVDGYCF